MPARAYHEAFWEAMPAGLQPTDFELRLRFLLDRVRAGERILDVGCGEGQFASALAKSGASVVGVDLAEEPLRRARRRDPSLELLLIEEAQEWPLADASFDLVWAGETIEHVADTGGWLSEVRRVLRPHGRLLLSTPDHGPLRRLGLALSGRGFERHFDPCSDHLRFYTRRSLRDVLERYGFQAATVLRAGGLPGARRLLLGDAVRSRW